MTLAATNYIEVNGFGGQVIRQGTPALPATITSLGAQGVQIDTGGTAGNVWAQSKAVLLPFAKVTGNLYTNSPQIGFGATVSGQIITNAVYTPPTVTSWPVTFPAATVTDLDVFAGTSATKAPGRYGTLQIDPGATLNLSSGTYYVEWLNLAPFSTVKLDQTNGPVIIYIRNIFSYAGVFTTTTGAPPDLMVAYLGAIPVGLASPFVGTFISTAAITLNNFSSPHVGAFFAPIISVAPGATVIYRAPATILAAAPPSGGVQSCASQIRPRDDLTGKARDEQFQTDIARYCTSPGKTLCLNTLTGRANVDYTDAALNLRGAIFTPAQYLALSHDRRRKLTNAQASATLANTYCAGPDADDDWVPDALDLCPNTPPLTPTDDKGCPTPIPNIGPSQQTFQSYWPQMNAMVDPLCNGAPAPGEVSGAAMWQTFHPSVGMFIVANAIANQPVGCHTWYLFQVRTLGASGPTGAPFMVAFETGEAIATVGGLGLPMPASYIEFLATAQQGGDRAKLAAIINAGVGMSFRVQAINGNGLRGPWSDWKQPNESDCLELGVYCQQE